MLNRVFGHGDEKMPPQPFATPAKGPSSSGDTSLNRIALRGFATLEPAGNQTSTVTRSVSLTLPPIIETNDEEMTPEERAEADEYEAAAAQRRESEEKIRRIRSSSESASGIPATPASLRRSPKPKPRDTKPVVGVNTITPSPLRGPSVKAGESGDLEDI